MPGSSQFVALPYDVSATFLSRDGVSRLHVHDAKPGCYNCRVVRAEGEGNGTDD